MVIRTLLIWLLALALPAQGVSAATMAFCGQARHHATAVAQAPADHHAAGIHQHHAGHAMADGVDDVAAAPASAAGDSHGCSACASCCSAGALLNAAPTVPAPEPAPTVFATEVPTVAAPVADGLERPPRSAIA